MESVLPAQGLDVRLHHLVSDDVRDVSGTEDDPVSLLPVQLDSW